MNQSPTVRMNHHLRIQNSANGTSLSRMPNRDTVYENGQRTSFSFGATGVGSGEVSVDSLNGFVKGFRGPELQPAYELVFKKIN